MYFPVDKRGSRLSVGLRNLDLANWFEIDEKRAQELEIKEQLLADNQVVMAESQGTEPASYELLDTALSNLSEFHSDLFDVNDEEVIDRERNTAIERGHPLLTLSRLLQEDFCIMNRIDDSWVLTSAALFSPSRWRLLDKVGKNLSGIHEPVPGYEEQIEAATQKAFERISVEQPLWRANWSLLDDPTLFQPTPAAARAMIEDAGNQVFFRVERQTLRKLATTGAVIFTIRTYVDPLWKVIDQVEGAIQILQESLESTDEHHEQYKGWRYIKPAVLDYIQNHPTK